MWYVIQVRSGEEEKLRLLCEQQIPDRDVLQRSFIPYFERKKKIRNNWKILKKRLFPGYVFLVSDNLEALCVQLNAIPVFTRLLDVGGEIIPLTEEEVQFLTQFGGEEQIVSMSEGVIEGGRVRVVKGPLKDREGQIKHIDRHRRKAWIEIKMFGRQQLVEVGLEIVAKS